jgi:hypothetical protein
MLIHREMCLFKGTYPKSSEFTRSVRVHTRPQLITFYPICQSPRFGVSEGSEMVKPLASAPTKFARPLADVAGTVGRDQILWLLLAPHVAVRRESR